MNDDESATPAGTVDNFPYMRLDYTISDLKGTISSTTDYKTAQKIGSYTSYYYYGPQMSYRGSASMYAGIEEIVNQMHLGGSCKVVVPGWLLTNNRYSTKQKYLDNMKEATEAKIYEIKIVDLIEDVDAWDLNFVKTSLGSELESADSLDVGVYYVCDTPSDDEETSLESGDKVYINYICRRMLDGQGVDTNMADSAKVFGTYSASRTYEPTLINWASEASSLTMTSSETSIVSGFSTAIFQMRPHEKGRVFITSSQAYGSTGSGSAIPAYCPIIFEIEFVSVGE